MAHNLIYMTTESEAVAERIGRALVGERLAASGNVLSQVASVYWWNDELQETREAALILKTRETLVQALVDRIQELHSYSCPGILAWQVATGNSHYLNWIAEQTEATPSEPESGDGCVE